jgi:hypothetical protein
MTGTARVSAFFVLLALARLGAGSQDSGLPPGILLLSRVKRHVKQELEHLPEYTCLETVQRFGVTAANTREKPKAGKKEQPATKFQLDRIDTVRLEILYSGNKELYSSPGGSHFREENLGSFVVGGMIGDGLFASHLHTIFVSETAIYTYRGEETVTHDRGWAQAVKYDYRVPQNHSGWSINVPGAKAIVGSKGSFWVDPETQDVLRVEIHADEIPPELRVEEASIILNYGRMRIGENEIMLPQTAEMHMLLANGTESSNEFDFTHCRSYHAERSISFETADAPVPKPGADAPTVGTGLAIEDTGTVPAGLLVPVTLATAVDIQSTVGTLLQGRVSNNVDYQGKTLIPEGSTVRGRIRRLEHVADAGGYFVAGLEFTEVQTDSGLLRFYADLLTASGAPGLEWTISNPNSRSAGFGESVLEVIRVTNLPGVGSFFIKGSTFALPAGFRMQWRTRAFGK